MTRFLRDYFKRPIILNILTRTKKNNIWASYTMIWFSDAFKITFRKITTSLLLTWINNTLNTFLLPQSYIDPFWQTSEDFLTPVGNVTKPTTFSTMSYWIQQWMRQRIQQTMTKNDDKNSTIVINYPLWNQDFFMVHIYAWCNHLLLVVILFDVKKFF